MTELMDFQILQRADDGYAHVIFGGIYDGEIFADTCIEARIVREDDNLNVIYWTPCIITGQKWSVELDIPEGGLYRLEACIKSHDPAWRERIKCLYHIGVGDIYVMVGQSNMAGYGRDNAFDPPSLGVHALANNGRWCIATHPLADSIDSDFGHPENATGTSPALSFARRLKERLGVPIGIVMAAVGGTSLAAWHPQQDSNCYEEMCRRLELIGGFKGFVWYQGCADANRNDAVNYFERFSNMVDLWRERYGNLPLLTVQLNRWTGMNSGENDRWWGMICDAQRRAALELQDVYVVPSMDLSVTDGIHNSSGANVIIGERLANVALACIYKKCGQTSAFVLGAEKVDDTHVLVHLTPDHHIVAMDNLAIGMNVEDETGILTCHEAQPVPDGLVVSTSRPYQLPAKFHYAWRTKPPVFVVRDIFDMPLLSCYGVEIEPKNILFERSYKL